jgi:CRISPR system Cascade subunit CasE
MGGGLLDGRGCGGGAVMSVLTRVIVEKKQAAARHLSDSYAWHKALWQAFPEKNSRDFLWRLEDTDDAFHVYIVSPEAPSPQPWGVWQSKPIGDGFLGHGRYRFKVRVNPVMRRKSDGRRLGLFVPEKIEAWFLRHAQTADIALERVAYGPALDQPFFKDGRRGLHRAVEIEGILRVDDADKFKTAFYKGIGPAKAFGFGLLVLQPINQNQEE